MCEDGASLKVELVFSRTWLVYIIPKLLSSASAVEVNLNLFTMFYIMFLREILIWIRKRNPELQVHV